MNISEPFIRKPVATTLLLVAITLAGAAAYRLLPVSPLPQVEFPTISVSAGLPGASPETMASSVATPLERQFGRIAAVTEMTSSSALGSHQHHAAIRSESRHRRRRARRTSRHQRRPRQSAIQSSQQPYVPESESGRLSHFHAGPYLARPDQRPDVRRRFDDHGAETGPGEPAWGR